MVMRIDDRAASEALRASYERYYARLVHLSFLLADDRSQAEDVVQDAFVHAAQRLAELGEDGRLPYLRAAVVNGWRSRRRHASVEERSAPRLATDPEYHDAMLEDRSAMWACIAALPERQRACVVLRYYEDLPDEEIGQLLLCRTGTVRSQISRALMKLREVVDR